MRDQASLFSCATRSCTTDGQDIAVTGYFVHYALIFPLGRAFRYFVGTQEAREEGSTSCMDEADVDARETLDHVGDAPNLVVHNLACETVVQTAQQRYLTAKGPRSSDLP